MDFNVTEQGKLLGFISGSTLQLYSKKPSLFEFLHSIKEYIQSLEKTIKIVLFPSTLFACN